VARALAAAVVVPLLAVSTAGGAPAQTPRRGGMVVVALAPDNEPACLRVWAPECASSGLWPTKVLAYPFTPGPEGWRPGLASGYVLGTRPFTVTYHLRPEARWSDGTRVSAQDFVFARSTYLKHGAVPDPAVRALASDDPFRTVIRRVVAVDSRTVRFVFRRPYGNWRSLLFFPPLPHHALEGEDLSSVWRDRVDNPKTARPIASGPFHVGQWERGKQVALVRNTRYWGPHPSHLDRVIVRFVRVDLIDDALRSGDVDLGLPRTGIEDFQRDPRLKPFFTLNPGWEHLEFRVSAGGHPALRNKVVRRALAYGIDRVALVALLFPELERPRPLDNTFYVPAERGYAPNWSRYRYRPGEARRLLEQAGCRRGDDDVYVCSGRRLQLRFATTAGSPQRERALALIQTQLLRAGVEVQPAFATPSALFEQLLPTGNFDVALFRWLFKLAPQEVESPYRCGGDRNFSGWCSRLFTADVNDLERMIRPERRAVVANRADRRLVRDVPVLPLFQPLNANFARRNLHGLVPNTFGALLWNAEDWWLER